MESTPYQSVALRCVNGCATRCVLGITLLPKLHKSDANLATCPPSGNSRVSRAGPRRCRREAKDLPRANRLCAALPCVGESRSAQAAEPGKAGSARGEMARNDHWGVGARPL